MNTSTPLVTPIFWATIFVVIGFSYFTVYVIKNPPKLNNERKGTNPLFIGLMVFALGFYVIWSMKDSILWSIQEHKGLMNTQGIVTQSKTYWKSKGWHYEIWYEYSVDGNIYKSDRVSYGHTGSSDKSFALDYVSKYPVGKSVVVYYDAIDPNKSVLEPDVYNYDWVFVIVMIATLGSSFLAIGLAQKTRPTPRALDRWESAAFSSIFPASSLYCSQAESTPAHLPVTQTVGQP
jgi:hypothetical protein